MGYTSTVIAQSITHDPNLLYTVQLGAFQSEKNARKQARQFTLDPDEMGIAHTYHNGRFWYILAYGVYDQPHTARNEAKRICRLHGMKGCWARNIGEVNQLMEEAKRRQAW